MKFASRVFWIAAIVGIVALLPLYFVESLFPTLSPPAITHPEFYYGFASIGLAWHVAFIQIAREPVRLRPVMIAAALEKLGFGAGGMVLFALGRVAILLVPVAMADLVFASLFMLAYMRTPERF